MKNKQNLLLAALMLLTLGACDTNTSGKTNENSSSIIENVESIIRIRAYAFALRKGQVTEYDYLDNVSATDSIEGDISASLTYRILNFYTGNEVLEEDVNYNDDGKFHVEYTARNSKGQSASKKVIMVIGSPDQVFDEYGNRKLCWGTNYDYDYNAIQEDYKLVYEENFDANYSDTQALDPAEWKYEIGRGIGGWGNNEEQYYTRDLKNCFVSDGKLVIRARKLIDEGERASLPGVDYTSARVKTFGDTAWRYGRFDITAKLPKGAGSWPAIWMMPRDSHYGGWPKSGEIDIMETTHNYFYGAILGTTHTQNGSGGNSVGGNKYFGETIYENYHTYSIEWLPDKIIWYVDNVEYFRYDPTRFSLCPTYIQWPYDQPFYLILNVAIGGGLGGNVASDLFETYDVSMYVDSVKVYQSDIIANLKQTEVK